MSSRNKYLWAIPLKDKRGKTVLNGFIELVNKSNCKPNKVWVDQGRELYNKLIQEWLDNNNVLTLIKLGFLKVDFSWGRAI